MAIAGKKNSELQYWAPEPSVDASPLVRLLFECGRNVMEWFSKRTSIAGIQLPNWIVVLGAIIVILIVYTSIH